MSDNIGPENLRDMINAAVSNILAATFSENIAKWGGTSVTGRDISQDLAKLDIALTTLRDALLAGTFNGNIQKLGGTTLTGRDISQDLAKLDIALTTLRDAVTGSSPNNKTLYDLFTLLYTTGIMVGNSLIAVPTDKQSIYRYQAFLTTTPLGSGASYTSSSFDGILFRRLTGRAYADKAGTLNLQHSDDGTTWDTLTSISVPAATATKYDEPLYARYVRVNYVNGADAQGTFRLSGYLSAE